MREGVPVAWNWVPFQIWRVLETSFVRSRPMLPVEVMVPVKPLLPETEVTVPLVVPMQEPPTEIQPPDN